MEKFKEAGAAKKAKKSLPSPADAATAVTTATEMPPADD